MKLGWHLLSLQEGNNQQEEGVRAETTCVGVIEAPNFEHLLQHQDKWLNQLVLIKVLFHQRHTLKTIVEISHLGDVDLDWL